MADRWGEWVETGEDQGRNPGARVTGHRHNIAHAAGSARET